MTDRAPADLLDSIFRLASELLRGERMSLLLREEDSTDFVIAQAIGLAEDVKRRARVREGVGVAGRVAETRRPILAGAAGDPPVAGRAPDRYRSDSFVVVPIVVGGESRGVLSVADRVDGKPFGPEDLQLLELVASHIGACLVLRDQGEALERIAETDPVTWLFNRRHFDRRIDSEVSRAVRSGSLLALLMIDIDRFKSYNDRFGHGVGDAVLRTVAASLRGAIRPYDVATRFGGDEFAVILPEADSEVGGAVARRILERVGSAALPPELVAAGETIGLSIGIATFPQPAADPAALVEASDAAMYEAKSAGGGVRVWAHSHADGPRGRIGAARRTSLPYTPFLAEPSRLATPALQALLPAELAETWNAVVVGRDGAVLTVALAEPDPLAIDEISKATGLAVYPVYSNAADLAAARARLR